MATKNRCQNLIIAIQNFKSEDKIVIMHRIKLIDEIDECAVCAPCKIYSGMLRVYILLMCSIKDWSVSFNWETTDFFIACLPVFCGCAKLDRYL